MKLDTDPEIWATLEIGSGSRIMLSILNKKFKYNFREKIIFLKKLQYKKIMSPEFFFKLVESLNGEFMS